jgi:hypothetical protein
MFLSNVFVASKRKRQMREYRSEKMEDERYILLGES